MPRDIKRHTDFLLSLGTDKVPHSGDDVFMTHLISVYRDLEAWGGEEPVCLGGLYHSIYGTELFKRFALGLDRRGEVRALAGERAERLGYLNSAMDRASFDAMLADGGPRRMRDRFTDQVVVLADREFEDLCQIHLCDWLEQLPRGQHWALRRGAYRHLAEHLGGVAKEAHDRVYATAPTGAFETTA